MHGAIRPILHAAAAAPVPERARLSALLLILAILLVFVFGLLVILAVRRSMRPLPSRGRKAAGAKAGAWSEAGRRATPVGAPGPQNDERGEP